MLAPERQAHLDHVRRVPARARRAVERAERSAGRSSVPEPSPLFWQHFSERVRGAIDADARPAATGRRGCDGRCSLPLGALAMVILALAIAGAEHDRHRCTGRWRRIARGTWLADATAGRCWRDLVGDIDLETASAAGVIEPGVAEQAVLRIDRGRAAGTDASAEGGIACEPSHENDSS